jgi:hypothetical protein
VALGLGPGGGSGSRMKALKFGLTIRILMDLKLQHVWLVYPGEHIYPIDTKITA